MYHIMGHFCPKGHVEHITHLGRKIHMSLDLNRLGGQNQNPQLELGVGLTCNVTNLKMPQCHDQYKEEVDLSV